jgi:Flp pilus assembly CpaE family ATPase
MRATFVSQNRSRIDWFRDSLQNIQGQSYDFEYLYHQHIDQIQIPKDETVLFFDLSENATDSNLQEMSQLASRFPGQIVAVGNAKYSQDVLQSLRAGACDYLDTNRLELDLENIWKRLRKNTVEKPSSGKIVLVVSSNGGTGVSTIAANLAVAMNMTHHLSVCLVDFDLDQGDICGLMNLNPTFSLEDFLRPNVSIDCDMFDRTLTPYDKTGVKVLTTPKSINMDPQFTEDSILQTLEMCRTKFPLTIIDMPRGYSQMGQRIIEKADLILVVHRLDYQSIRNTSRFLEFEVNECKIPATKFQMITNRKGQPFEVELAKAEEVLNATLDWSLPNDPKTANLACNVGIPAVIDAPQSPLAIGFQQISLKLLNRMSLAKPIDTAKRSHGLAARLPSFIASFMM